MNNNMAQDRVSDHQNSHSVQNPDQDNTSQGGAKDTYLIKRGLEMIHAQETRNLFRDLEKRNMVAETIRQLDNKLERGMKSGMKITRDNKKGGGKGGGLSLCKSAMMLKLKDARRLVRQKTREYEEEKVNIRRSNPEDYKKILSTCQNKLDKERRKITKKNKDKIENMKRKETRRRKKNEKENKEDKMR